MIEVFPAQDTEFELESGETGATIMDGFDITALDGSGFNIQFTFTDPLSVSTGINPDLLLL